MSELPLVFLAERLELPASSGTDVALAARKLRLLGQLRSGLGPWGAIVSAAAATTIAAKAAKAPIATVSVIDSKVLEFPGWFRIPISSSSRECQEVAERGSFSIILTSSSRPAERVAGGRPWSKRGINRPLCHLCGRNARPRHTRLLDKRCRVVRAMLFLGDAAQLLFVLCTLGYLACAGVVNGAAPALQSLWGSRLRVCEAGVAGFECRRNQRP